MNFPCSVARKIFLRFFNVFDLPHVKLQSQNNQSVERKGLFYENENFNRNKFD